MRKLLEEIMGLDQEDAAMEPQAPIEQEITPELMASLVEQMPELADVDQEELEKGIKVEMEHLTTVGDDMLTVAKIALDHIKETPEGKSYYDALAQMEQGLQEIPGEEAEEQLPGGEEEGAAVEELPMESVKEAVETVTNEEAQAMVDSGEATIPPEAVIENPEKE